MAVFVQAEDFDVAAEMAAITKGECRYWRCGELYGAGAGYAKRL
jgi:hypothetical protein